jgi:glycosyltransferase involved in cell wall biosynthesis
VATAHPPVSGVATYAVVARTSAGIGGNSPGAGTDDEETLVQHGHRPVPAVTDLVVLSHLRWHWVWQRPQHLVSRMARRRADVGARTWFVEEPMPGEVPAPVLHTEDCGDVTRVCLVVPASEFSTGAAGFAAAGAERYAEQLSGLFASEGRPPSPDVWLYTPMALDIALAVGFDRLAYDVMDDLASFAHAPEALVTNQRRALAHADVVYAGGRSLHRGVVAQGRPDCHLFPSGVETDHYERARALRGSEPTRVAGYVGVIDERLDLRLLAELASSLPDWTIRMVGPVTKIDPATLPRASNIDYTGMAAYEQLPEVMAGLDVALMPFALNAATRSISPTKTLEYLAAGLPVVSTRVPDVVEDFGSVVHFADDGSEFADACREVAEHRREERDRRLRPVQAAYEWDDIADRMARALEDTPSRVGPETPDEAVPA